MIELRVLGALDVRASDGTELHQLAVQPKLIALLTFLALAKPRGFHRRDKIVAYFWPELDQEHARAALRASLHRIRQAVGTDVILRRGHEDLAIDPARLWCDACACEDAIDAKDAKTAHRLYRGELLDAFFIPDAAPEFDQWLDTRRAELRQRIESLGIQTALSGETAFTGPPPAQVNNRPFWISAAAVIATASGAWWFAHHQGVPRAPAERAREARAAPSRWTSLSGDNAQALTQHSVAIHQRFDRLYVFGGRSGSLIRGEMWRIVVGDHGIANWDSVSVKGSRPAPRWGHTAVFDSANNRMIVFGGALGHSSPCSNETWVLVDPDGWNESPHWIKLEPRGTVPPARANHSAVYDQRRNRLIVYGGHDCFAPRFNDVWVLQNANGLGGSPVWSKLNVANGPRARVNHVAAYDAATNRMLVWGGTDKDQIVSNVVWVLESANGIGSPHWHVMKVRGLSPPGRYGASAGYNSASHRLMVFGGSPPGDCSNDVWLLEHADESGKPEWHKLVIHGAAPQPRCVAASGYDIHDRMFILGGEEGAGGVFADMWMLDHASGH